MSEYQYYEFLAVDRPLTDKQMESVRKYSSRARITSTQFVNEYHWGDFKGEPHDFLRRFFDLYVYYANWGTHRFAFRVPAGAIDPQAAKRYACENLTIKPSSDVVILDFSSDSEEDGDWEQNNGLMASLAPVREEVLSGDYRPLYIAWLAAVTAEEEPDEEDEEPPLPAGLGELSAAQQALTEFLRVDEDLLAAAAEASPKIAPAEEGLAAWIAALPETEKNNLLVRMCEGSDPHAIVALRRRFQAFRASTRRPADRQAGRTVGELRDRSRQHAELRRQAADGRRAEEEARQEAVLAKAKAARLAALAQREPAAWDEVEALIATKQAPRYDQAVGILADLRDLAAGRDEIEAFASRMRDLHTHYASRSSLTKKLVDAGLIVR